jgi:hypothetical protein
MAADAHARWWWWWRRQGASPIPRLLGQCFTLSLELQRRQLDGAAAAGPPPPPPALPPDFAGIVAALRAHTAARFALTPADAAFFDQAYAEVRAPAAGVSPPLTTDCVGAAGSWSACTRRHGYGRRRRWRRSRRPAFPWPRRPRRPTTTRLPPSTTVTRPYLKLYCIRQAPRSFGRDLIEEWQLLRVSLLLDIASGVAILGS